MALSNRLPKPGILSMAAAAIDLAGIRRTRAGRRLIAAINVVGERGARFLYLHRGSPVLVDGHMMFLSGRHAPSLAFVTTLIRGHYEADAKALMQGLVREGMTVFDVGAHVGHYTLMAAKLVGPRGRVYAFEPEPDNYAILAKNVALNGYANVICVPKAISDRTGVLTFYLSHQGNDRHSIVGSPDASAHVSRCEVPAITLDQFSASIGWPRVDVIKMDIEGAEPMAIAGMAQLLRRSGDLNLIIEFAPEILRAGGTDPSAFLATLTSLGFTTAPVESDVPPNVLEAATLDIREIEKRGVINLICKKLSKKNADATANA